MANGSRAGVRGLGGGTSHTPIHQVQGGAEIMYYGGDIAELLPAAALVAIWRPEHRRAAHREAVAPREATAHA